MILMLEEQENKPRIVVVGVGGAGANAIDNMDASGLRGVDFVAINTDADASIFRYARFGIVGDCLEILPELIRAAKENQILFRLQ